MELTIRSAFKTDLMGLVPRARLFRPDGSTVDITTNDMTPWGAGYTASISNMPFAGVYELRIMVEPDSGTRNHPGEANITGPPNTVAVPPLQRSVSQYFYVTGGAKTCPSGDAADCDGDGIFGESSEEDFDGDGLPDDCDTDADNDDIPDALEWHENPDTDGDGEPDYRDTDADGDGVSDADDP